MKVDRYLGCVYTSGMLSRVKRVSRFESETSMALVCTQTTSGFRPIITYRAYILRESLRGQLILFFSCSSLLDRPKQGQVRPVDE